MLQIPYETLKVCSLINMSRDEVNQDIVRYSSAPYTICKHMNRSFEVIAIPGLSAEAGYPNSDERRVYIPFHSSLSDHLVFKYRLITGMNIIRRFPLPTVAAHYWGWDQFPFPLLSQPVIEFVPSVGWVLRSYRNVSSLIDELKDLAHG